MKTQPKGTKNTYQTKYAGNQVDRGKSLRSETDHGPIERLRPKGEKKNPISHKGIRKDRKEAREEEVH